MKKRLDSRAVSLFLGLCLLALMPAGLAAQEETQDKATLTLRDVKERLKENQKYLDEAQKRGKAGDTAGLETALENHNRSVEALDRAMSQGRFEGNEFEREKAFERVESATRKHTEVLQGLLTKVPEQARPHIQHAIEVSQKGRTTALANLERARGERQAAEMRRGGEGRTGRIEPSGGVGRPGGVGGGPGGGVPGGVAGGASGGRGRGPR